MVELSNKNRLSNYELLRIFAMILIMFGHTHLRMDSMQITEPIVEVPSLYFLKNILSCITITGVGIFIAISGWFGIKFKIRGVVKYLYLVFFTLWVVYGIAIALHIAEFNISGVKISMSFFDGYWFVMGYLGLYLISPILNIFIEHSTKKSFQVVLISFFLFQSYYSWLSGWYDYYDGYSIILFSGIYLTAAYFRKYPVRFVEKNALQLWIAIILLMALISSFTMWKFGHAGRMIRDDNPMAIWASILLLLSFKQLKFQSKIVNRMAASCFAVYLIHYSPFVYPYLMQYANYVFSQFHGFLYAIMLLLLLIIVFIGCFLFDQVRIITWNFINKSISNVK